MRLLLYNSQKLPLLLREAANPCSASPSGLGCGQGGPDNIACDRRPPWICNQAKMQKQLWPLRLCRVRLLRGERDCCSGNESSGSRCSIECCGRWWCFKTKILLLLLQELTVISTFFSCSFDWEVDEGNVSRMVGSSSRKQTYGPHSRCHSELILMHCRKRTHTHRGHRTRVVRQPVKIVYYRTGFIVEALPHIKFRHWTTQPRLGPRTGARQVGSCWSQLFLSG